MSHVRMWSVAFNEMVHSSELKSRWVMSCGWNLACLSTADVFNYHLNYFPAWQNSGILHLWCSLSVNSYQPNLHAGGGRASILNRNLETDRILMICCWHNPASTPNHEDPAAVRLRLCTLAMGSVIRCHFSISGPLDEIWANILLPFDSCRQLDLFLLSRFFSFSFF